MPRNGRSTRNSMQISTSGSVQEAEEEVKQVANFHGKRYVVNMIFEPKCCLVFCLILYDEGHILIKYSQIRIANK